MAKPSKKPPKWATASECLHTLARRAAECGHVLVVLSADLVYIRDEQTGELIGQGGCWDDYVLSAGQYQHASGLLVLRPNSSDLVCLEDVQERLDELESPTPPAAP